MAKKKADANKTPETAAPAAETETPVAEAETPVELSEPVTESGDAGGADKKAADKTRREKAITEYQEAVDAAPVNKELEASDKKKAKLLAKLDDLAAEVAVHDAAIDVLRDESAAIVLELYPQQGENDPPSQAIRGYLNASARERQHRKLAPVRLKAILEKAGLAPIDAAFSRARGRGMARPARKVAKKAAAPAADQAKDATPTKKAE